VAEPTPVGEWKPDYGKSFGDLRGEPSHSCICGCEVLNVKCIFIDYEIAVWFTDAECASCGTKLTAPTPADKGNPNGNL